MATSSQLADTVDTSRVSLRKEVEVRFWTQRFGVSREDLERAVKRAGTMPSAVAIELSKT